MTARRAIDDALRAAVGDACVAADAPLAPLTTFKVGGPADYLVDVHDETGLAAVLAIAAGAGLPVTVLGGGSNLLVADAGVRGVVLRLRLMDITSVKDGLVRAGAGVTINGLVRWTITHGRAGLEAWAGTPGTVGGAVYGNAHFRGRLISELVHSVRLLTRDGQRLDVPAADMGFGYDVSRLQGSGEVLVSASFVTREGHPETLRATARESLAFRKRTQPLASPSAGCIFQNPDPARDTVPDGIPPSAGALVDRAGLKGAEHGRARVSSTHANFIVNDGGATAAEIRALIDRCKAGVRDRFGVDLLEEIVTLGFDERR